MSLASDRHWKPTIANAFSAMKRSRHYCSRSMALLLREFIYWLHSELWIDWRLIYSRSSAVKRRRKELGFHSPRVTMRTMPYQEMVQLVVEELNRDHARSRGVQNIQARITFNCGVTLSRDFVSDIMHTHDEEGFTMRDPSSKRIIRVIKSNIGIHERWSGDGHDKLYSIGFPIWAVVDEATTKWLGAWVVPSNRLGDVVGYLCLLLIEKFGGMSIPSLLFHTAHQFRFIAGMPLQFATDCGSETTQLYGLVNALRYSHYLFPNYFLIWLA